MPISDEHHVLKADLEGAIRSLGVEVRNERRVAEQRGAARAITLTLPKSTPVKARFMRESFVQRAKKLFVDEVEVGAAWFDDLIYVMTSTRDETAEFLKQKRVQQALILLVDDARCVEVEDRTVRLIDEEGREPGRDVVAELLALAANLIGTQA